MHYDDGTAYKTVDICNVIIVAVIRAVGRQCGKQLHVMTWYLSGAQMSLSATYTYQFNRCGISMNCRQLIYLAGAIVNFKRA